MATFSNAEVWFSVPSASRQDGKESAGRDDDDQRKHELDAEKKQRCDAFVKRQILDPNSITADPTCALNVGHPRCKLHSNY